MLYNIILKIIKNILKQNCIEKWENDRNYS